MNKTLLLIGSAALIVSGCSVGDSSATFNGPTSGGAPIADTVPPVVDDGTPQPQVEDPNACHMGRQYEGFGGRVLVAGRVEEPQNQNRFRVKPFSALKGEYERVLGQSPTILAQMGGTFSQPPARWYEEPQASAVTLYTSYRLGFVGCLTLTSTGDAYASAPDVPSATNVCGTLARQFWSRTPTQAELDTCVKVATQDTTKETDPRRRWAYTCASLLSSAGFLSY